MGDDEVKKTRLGILMDSPECSRDLFELFNSLATDPNVELYLLQNNPKMHETLVKRITTLIKEVGFIRFVDLSFFMFIVCLEKKIMSFATSPESCTQFRLESDIFAETVLLTPILSRTKISKRNILVSYGDEDIEKIQSLGLDLMMRGNGSGIYQGKILTASNGGILSFHHGDNRWNRGGPPGFWEVYFKVPATGFIIQILNERLDDGDVIFRGEVPTQIVYTLNQRTIFQAGNTFMKQIIKGYAATRTLPPVLPKEPFSNTLLQPPKFTETLTYLAKTALLLTTVVFKGRILKQEQRWSVAFVSTDWKISNLSKGIVIKNPKGRFLADPFVAIRDNQTVMFVEDFHFSTRRGAISAVRIFTDGSYEILPDIIREDFHLSFPYLFEYDGTLYMIPESSEVKAIRLYKCVQFPDRWEYMHDIMKGVDTVDTMMFEHSGKWWLLTNMEPESTTLEPSYMEHQIQLHVFCAKSPLSKDWQPHPKNPVCFSLECGRNGGLLRDADGAIFRVRQKQGFNTYGIMFSIARITKLDMEGYEETFYCDIEPKFFEDLVGTHHMFSTGGITVFDFAKEEIIW